MVSVGNPFKDDLFKDLRRQGILQIRTANTNVDDGVDLLASVTLPLTTAHLLRELLHVFQDRVDILNNALAVDLHGLVGGVAQGSVVHSTVLGEVDVVTTEHGIAELLHTGLLGQLNEQRQSLLGEEVLGEVEQDILVVDGVGEGVAELLKALGVLLEVLLQDNVATHGSVVLLELLPGIEIGGLRESRHDDTSMGSTRFSEHTGLARGCPRTGQTDVNCPRAWRGREETYMTENGEGYHSNSFLGLNSDGLEGYLKEEEGREDGKRAAMEMERAGVLRSDERGVGPDSIIIIIAAWSCPSSAGPERAGFAHQLFCKPPTVDLTVPGHQV